MELAINGIVDCEASKAADRTYKQLQPSQYACAAVNLAEVVFWAMLLPKLGVPNPQKATGIESPGAAAKTVVQFCL